MDSVDEGRRVSSPNGTGGAAVKVIVLVLVIGLAAAAWFFLSREDAGDLDGLVGKVSGAARDAFSTVSTSESIVFWYTVKQDEVALVKRLGAYVRQAGPGLHWKLPFAIEEVMRTRLTEIKRIEIGFRTVEDGYEPVPDEALMLTGGENIIDLSLSIQYRIEDPRAYVFNVKAVDKVMKDAAMAAIRAVIGRHDMDEALTAGKGMIQDEASQYLQGIMDSYGAGIRMVALQLQDVHPPQEVREAFKDVQSAKEDHQRSINEAESYYNEVVPSARGKASEIVNQAEASMRERMLRAEGDVSVFKKLLEQYRLAPEVTRKRIYFESMEDALSESGAKKIIISESAGEIYKLLPIEKLQ